MASAPLQCDTKWLFSLREEVLGFLSTMAGKKRKGFYQYSLTGDYIPKDFKWGLGNSTFFLKIVYTLNAQDVLSKEVDEAVAYIKSFQKKNGVFFDPWVRRLSFLLRLLQVIRKKNLQELDHHATIRAESRQSISSLALFGEKPNYDYPQKVSNKEDVFIYLDKLDWEKPWHAGSHFSHLLFFLQHSNLENKNELIEVALGWVNEIQHFENGFWYKGSPSIRQKINGAMKIITGMVAVGRVNIKYADKIFKECLAAKNDEHACDNFNIVYVLKYCRDFISEELVAETEKEFQQFLCNRLKLYKKHYFKDIGGFSFFRDHANRVYYSAPLSKGKAEPDIHGTVLFLWGISLIAQLLGIEDELGFKEFIT